MPTATRLDTDMGNYMPVTRHYQVDGGYLAVTVKTFFMAKGTEIIYCDEAGGPISMEAIATFPEGTTHDEALESLGYTVVDEIGIEPDPEPEPEPPPAEPSVLDILPEPIAAMIAAATEGTP